MKQTFILCLATMMITQACKKEKEGVLPVAGNSSTVIQPYFRYSGPDYSQHICKDTADRMVASYLLSVNYPTSTSDIRYLTFNADSMRNFLTNGAIATLKFSLAHKLSYISSGNYGNDAGTSAGALTFLMAGLDEDDDDYIYRGDTSVYDLSNSQLLGRVAGNYMISSYRASTDYETTNADLRSLTFDADTMRSFLQNSSIVNLKFVIAHRDDYITDHYAENCGVRADGLTFVILGLNSSGQVVYTQDNKVMEHTRPCPSFCTISDLYTLY